MRIKAAAAAAATLKPRLDGGSRTEALARYAAVHLGVTAGISTQELSWALGLTRQGLAAALTQEAPRVLRQAKRIRAALELEVERRSRASAKG